jgi:Zn-dependent protease with chaperone function
MQLLLSITCVVSASALSATSSPPSTRVKLTNLKAESFRHPLDKDLTRAVQRTPLRFLEKAVRTTAGSTMEEMLRLDNLATGVKVSEKQFPALHASFREAIACLGGMKPEPELFVKSDPRPNAYTLAVRGGAPFVVVTSALVDGFSAAETQAVLGHELGHLVCEHSLWFSLGSIGSTLLPPLPGVGAAAERIQQEWRRAAEFSCDRAALLVAQDSAVVNETLIKLASGSTAAVDVDAYLQQAREYDEALEKSSRFVRTMQGRMLADATHPLPIRRVAELDRFAKSAQYKRIIAKGERAPE